MKSMATDFVTLFDLKRCREMLAIDSDEPQIEKDLRILEECDSGGSIYIDYCACYVELFSGEFHPGSIVGTELSPLGETSFLLMPEHVDQMLTAIEKHADELRVMTAESIAQLREWGDVSRRDARFCVMYHMDC
jgi:hypothetical protein